MTNANIQVPGSLLDIDTELKAKYGELTKLRTEHRAAQDRAYELRQVGLAEAEQRDRDAYATALRTNKADPGPKNVTRLEKELADEDRKAGALGTAVEATAAELDKMLDERGDDLRTQVAERIDVSRAAYQAAIDAALAALGAFAGELVGQIWLKRPDHKRHSIPVPVVLGGVPGLTRASGESYRPGDALAALRRVGDPPARSEPSVHAPRGAPWPVTGLRDAVA